MITLAKTHFSSRLNTKFDLQMARSLTMASGIYIKLRFKSFNFIFSPLVVVVVAHHHLWKFCGGALGPKAILCVMAQRSFLDMSFNLLFIHSFQERSESD
jgi:hypothetical protein